MSFFRSTLLGMLIFAAIATVSYTNIVIAKPAKGGLPPYNDLLKLWNQPYPPFKIFDRVYYVGTSLIAVFLVDSGDGLILIDSGMSEQADIIQNNIKKLGFDIKNVRILLSTHAHFDHVGGHKKIKDLSQAQVWASSADSILLNSGGKKSFFPFYAFPSVKVEKEVKDKDVHKIGVIELETVLTPGHTEGATSWLITIPVHGKKRRVIVASSLSVNDGVELRNNNEWPDVYQSYKNTFSRLKKIEAEIFLTAHSDLFEMDQKRKALLNGDNNPFIDPKALKRYIGKFEEKFLKLTQK